MEPLYTTQSNWSYEEYKKYSIFFMYRRTTQIVLGVIIGFTIVCYVGLIALAIWTGDTFECIFYLLFIALLLSIYLLLPRYRMLKSYKSNKHIKDRTVTIKFFENRLETEEPSGCGKIMYDEIYKIYETKTNFYIMLSVNQGMNVIKANCSDGLIAHLQRLRESIKK